MGNDLSIWALVLDASTIVQGVMVLLMVASLVSWAVIFQKGRVISRSRRQADQFETAFWSGGDLTALYRSIETKGRAGTGEQSIFESGFGEYSRLRQLGTPPDQLLEGPRRARRKRSFYGQTGSPPQADGRDQCGAVYRRHAGAAGHLHDYRAAAQGGRQSGLARRRRQAHRPRIHGQASAADRDHRLERASLHQSCPEPGQARV